MHENTVMTSQDMSRSLARIGHEIIEKNRSAANLVMIGIHTRGVPIAERLAEIVGKLVEHRIPVGQLDISRYRDDTPGYEKTVNIHGTDIPGGVDGKTVILVDDVLFTGRSIRAAMDALMDRGRPLSIQLAVLVDRGHRELPIRADYIGKNIPSARKEEIRVKLLETDGEDEVVIIKNSQEEGRGNGMENVLIRKER